MAVTFQDKVELLGKYKDKEGYETLIQAYKFGKNIDSPKLNDAQRNQIRTNIDTLYKELSAEIKKQKARESKSASGGKKKTILGLASEIRKRDNITWDKAKAKARMEFQSERKQAIREEKQDLADFKKRIGKINFLRATTYTKQGKVVSTDIKKDKVIPALPSGKRYPKRGKTTNGEGTFKNNTKKPYWENRANRMDVNQPSKQAKIKLADGGNIDKNIRFDVDFYDDNNTRKETSVELILRGSSLDNVIKDAIKKAYELKKNYIEFYNRNSFLGSINLAISSDFREGRDYREGKIKLADGGQTNESVEIGGFNRNIMGTLSFDLKLKKMRKPQEFIVYPAQEKSDTILIQSDTRFGLIEMKIGEGLMSQSHANGAYGYHLQADKKDKFKLSDEQLSKLKEELAKTAGKKVGSSVVFSDNSYADKFAKGGEVGGNFEVINFGGDRYDGGVSYEIKQNGKSVQKGLIDGDSGIDFNGKHYSGLLSLTKGLNAKFVSASEYAKGGKVGGKEYFTIFSDEDGTIKTEFDTYEEGLADFHYFVEEDANISLYMVVNGEEKLLEEYTSSANIEYLKLGNSDVVVTLEKVDGKWQEMDVVEGEKPYGWGGKRYMGYLKPIEIVRYLNSDYGGTFEIIEQYAKGGKVSKKYDLKDAKKISENERFELKVLQGLLGFNSGLNINGLYESIGFSNYRFNKYATESQAEKVEKALNSLIKKGYVDESGLGYKITQKGADYKREFAYGSYAKGGEVAQKVFIAKEDGILGIASGSDAYSIEISKGDTFVTYGKQDDANWWYVKKVNKTPSTMSENNDFDYTKSKSRVKVNWDELLLTFPKGDKMIYAEMTDMKFAKGGEVEDMYVAVGEKDGYWTIVSTPSSKDKAEKLLEFTTLPRGEVGKVVSVEDAKKHKLVVGREYLKYAKGGEVKIPIKIKNKLEAIRKSIQNENVSYGELVELQSLSKYIDPSDVELREAAGIPEFEDEDEFAKGGETKKFGYAIELLVKKDYGNEDMVIANFVGKGDAMISARALNENSPENYDYSVKESSKISKKGTTPSLSSIRTKYDKNEDENRHSENVVLLAENFGNVNDLKLAKEILRKHNEEGSLSSENGKKRQNLHLKLITIAREEFAKEGIKFAKGGEIAEGNYEMMLSQAKEVHHHAKELQNILKNEKEIEAWVVAKMENVSSTLSDITHYLDGKTEYAKGGTTKRIKRMSK